MNDKVRYLTTIDLPLDRLRTHPENYRVHDVHAIAESRTENGQYKPITVKADDPDNPEAGGVILAGNGNYLAAKKNGEPTIRCELIDCTEQRALKILVADNLIQRLSSNNDRSLLEVLEKLDDLAGTSVTEDMFDDLRAAIEEGDRIFESGDQDGASDDPLGDLAPAKSIDEKEELYAESSTRMLVLTYPVDTFTVIVEKLATLAERYGVESNSDVVEHLVNKAVAEA